MRAMLALAFTATSWTSEAQRPLRWTVDPQPQLTLGAGDASGTFGDVAGATRLPDGSILVGDRGDLALHLFSAQGRKVRSFGRKGTGPGEIEYVGRLLRCGDSIYTHDAGNGGRTSVFTLDGRYVRQFRFTGPGEAQQPYSSACNARGTFVHIGWEDRRQMRAGRFRTPVPLWLSRPTEGVLRVLDSIPGSERWGYVSNGQPAGTGPLPFGKQPVIGISETRVYAGSADEFRVQTYDMQGRAGATLSRPSPPQRLERADINAYIERVSSRAPASARERIVQSFSEIEFPSTAPAYTALLVDHTNHVWIRSYTRADKPDATWSVFSPTGALVAEVSVPARLSVHEIGTDHILGDMEDEDTAEPLVLLYRLRRGSP